MRLGAKVRGHSALSGTCVHFHAYLHVFPEKDVESVIFRLIMPPFYLFTTLTSEVKQMWHIYKYVLKHIFRQDIFKQTYRNDLFRDNILTFAFILSSREFKHMWYQMYKSDYCLKHFKLVYLWFHI